MKKTVFVTLIVLLVFSGCAKKPQYTEKNGNFEVQLLFEQDGIRVYRFYDYGDAKYFTTRGDTFWTESKGDVTVPVNIPALEEFNK